MSCGTCSLQAGQTLAPDTGVPTSAPTTSRPRCPHCNAFISQAGAPCHNFRCPRFVLVAALPPVQALALARQHGPAPDTRQAACRDPWHAVLYAREVDKGPRDDTRQAACVAARAAFHYAAQIDQAPRDDTRAAACRDPFYAYWYALHVDHGPRADTRHAAGQDPHRAADYARYVDRTPPPAPPWDGMVPPHNCRRCGQPLNADGSHPAELYQGTYTGLCYTCLHAPPHVVHTCRDGAQRWSYPSPDEHDRPTYIAYPDCPTCHGQGRERRVSPARRGGDLYYGNCSSCLDRFNSHPARQHQAAAWDRLQALAQRQLQLLLQVSNITAETPDTQAQIAAYRHHIQTWLQQAVAALCRTYEQAGW